MNTNPLHLIVAGATSVATAVVSFFLVLGIAEERQMNRATKKAATR